MISVGTRCVWRASGYTCLVTRSAVPLYLSDSLSLCLSASLPLCLLLSLLAPRVISLFARAGALSLSLSADPWLSGHVGVRLDDLGSPLRRRVCAQTAVGRLC